MCIWWWSENILWFYDTKSWNSAADAGFNSSKWNTQTCAAHCMRVLCPAYQIACTLPTYTNINLCNGMYRSVVIHPYTAVSTFSISKNKVLYNNGFSTFHISHKPQLIQQSWKGCVISCTIGGSSAPLSRTSLRKFCFFLQIQKDVWAIYSNVVISCLDVSCFYWLVQSLHYLCYFPKQMSLFSFFLRWLQHYGQQQTYNLNTYRIIERSVACCKATLPGCVCCNSNNFRP